MRLYHFTSERHLSGISQHGLTVGDVPTDLKAGKGRVGIWFTSSYDPFGHGLGGKFRKDQFRLAVEFSADQPALHKWTDWYPSNVTSDTVQALHDVATNWDTWFVFFGVVRPNQIVECFDMIHGKAVADWRDRLPSADDLPGVPSWRRDAWQRSMLKKVAKAVRKSSGL